MKKLFTLWSLLLCFVMGAKAAEVTMAYPGGSTSTNMVADGSNEAATFGLDATKWSVVGSKGSASNAPGLNKDGDFRLYWHKDGSNSITVSALAGQTINSIKITFNTGKDNVTVTVGENAVTAKDGVWAINGSSFVLGNGNTTNVQVQIKSLVINYTDPAAAVDEPSITPAAGTYVGAQTISIETATEGATIYYTTDGGDPFASDAIYTAPFQITANTTVKAGAVKGDDKSSVATAEYTILEKIANTQATAYTATQALELTTTKDAAVLAHAENKVYVKGVIKEITQAPSTEFKNATYVITDGTSDFTIFRGKDLGNTDFTDENVNGLAVGKIATVYGNLLYFQGKQPEMAQGNYLVELEKLYAINVAEGIANGTVQVDKATAVAGEEVTITATPNEGYKLLSITVTGNTENQVVPVTNNKFTMIADDVNVSATFVQPEDITIAPTEGDIAAALKAATTDAGKIAKNITINLTKDVTYTLKSTIKGAANITINGNGATIDASEGDNILGIEGVTEFAKKTDGTVTDHSLVNAITIKDVTIKGMKKALIRDLMTKTLLETLTIDNCIIEASNAKVVVDFDGKGYVGKVVVKNSTIWAAAPTAKHFAKYGSRPKNVEDGPLYQEFDVQNSTIVNISANADFGGGQNFNNFNQKGTANNIYTLKNNIFVNCGKQNQVVVGFNAGQTSPSPVWDVDKNAFNWNGADVAAAEVTKAGQKNGADIVKNIVPGIVAFASETAITDGNFKLANCAQNTAHIGDPRWLDATVEPEAEDITIALEEGNINDALFNATSAVNKKAKDIYIYLAPGKKFTISQSIVAPAAFVIMGAAEGTNPSTIDETATMAEIDASALTGPLVLMSKTPAVEADANGFYPLNDVGFLNVKVTGLTQQLFYANKMKYLINCFHVDFCNINVAGGNKTIIDTNGGGVLATLDMSKNTIWANPENTGALYSSQSGQKATEAGLAVQTFNIERNTMYNIAKGKNFCSHRQSNQTWLTYNVKNNTFVNCGKSGQVIKGLNGGQSGANPTWVISGNAFNFDGTDTSAAESTGDEAEPVQNSLAGIFAFTDAANGDFNGVFKGQAAEAPTKYPGDPRWTYTYEAVYAINVVNTDGITITPEKAYAAEGEKVYATFTLQEGYDQERPDFVDDDNNPIAFEDGVTCGLEEVDGVEKMWIIMPAKNVTIIAKAVKISKITLALSQENGSATCLSVNQEDPSTFNKKAGKEIYLAITPDAGYEAEISVMAGETPVEVVAEEGTYSEQAYTHKFIMPAADVTITVTFTKSTGINGITTDDADANAPMYNLAGQKVTKSYKGVVIQNGKKYVNK